VTHFPNHDPDKNQMPDDLTDASPDISSTRPAHSYYPYPNQSLFMLEEWYWNDGVKKSQSSFQNLIGIVGHPNFQPEDVAGTNWQAINAQLSRVQECNDDGGWEDEPNDRDWMKTPIKFKVPFHKRMLHPGQKEFEAGILHHHKLVSVLKEKIT
jgi:hypothetical protein